MKPCKLNLIVVKLIFILRFQTSFQAPMKIQDDPSVPFIQKFIQSLPATDFSQDPILIRSISDTGIKFKNPQHFRNGTTVFSLGAGEVEGKVIVLSGYDDYIRRSDSELTSQRVYVTLRKKEGTTDQYFVNYAFVRCMFPGETPEGAVTIAGVLSRIELDNWDRRGADNNLDTRMGWSVCSKSFFVSCLGDPTLLNGYRKGDEPDYEDEIIENGGEVPEVVLNDPDEQSSVQYYHDYFTDLGDEFIHSWFVGSAVMFATNAKLRFDIRVQNAEPSDLSRNGHIGRAAQSDVPAMEASLTTKLEWIKKNLGKKNVDKSNGSHVIPTTGIPEGFLTPEKTAPDTDNSAGSTGAVAGIEASLELGDNHPDGPGEEASLTTKLEWIKQNLGKKNVDKSNGSHVKPTTGIPDGFVTPETTAPDTDNSAGSTGAVVGTEASLELEDNHPDGPGEEASLTTKLEWIKKNLGKKNVDKSNGSHVKSTTEIPEGFVTPEITSETENYAGSNAPVVATEASLPPKDTVPEPSTEKLTGIEVSPRPEDTTTVLTTEAVYGTEGSPLPENTTAASSTAPTDGTKASSEPADEKTAQSTESVVVTEASAWGGQTTENVFGSEPSAGYGSPAQTTQNSVGSEPASGDENAAQTTENNFGIGTDYSSGDENIEQSTENKLGNGPEPSSGDENGSQTENSFGTEPSSGDENTAPTTQPNIETDSGDTGAGGGKGNRGKYGHDDNTVPVGGDGEPKQGNDKQKEQGNDKQKGQWNKQKGQGNDKQKSQGNDKQIGQGNDNQNGQGDKQKGGQGNDKQKGQANDNQNGQGNEKQKGQGYDKQKGQGNDKQKGQGNDKQIGQGNDKQKGQGSGTEKGNKGNGAATVGQNAQGNAGKKGQHGGGFEFKFNLTFGGGQKGQSNVKQNENQGSGFEWNFGGIPTGGGGKGQDQKVNEGGKFGQNVNGWFRLSQWQKAYGQPKEIIDTGFGSNGNGGGGKGQDQKVNEGGKFGQNVNGWFRLSQWQKAYGQPKEIIDTGFGSNGNGVDPDQSKKFEPTREDLRRCLVELTVKYSNGKGRGINDKTIRRLQESVNNSSNSASGRQDDYVEGQSSSVDDTGNGISKPCDKMGRFIARFVDYKAAQTSKGSPGTSFMNGIMIGGSIGNGISNGIGDKFSQTFGFSNDRSNLDALIDDIWMGVTSVAAAGVDALDEVAKPLGLSPLLNTGAAAAGTVIGGIASLIIAPAKLAIDFAKIGSKALGLEGLFGGSSSADAARYCVSQLGLIKQVRDEEVGKQYQKSGRTFGSKAAKMEKIVGKSDLANVDMFNPIGWRGLYIHGSEPFIGLGSCIVDDNITLSDLTSIKTANEAANFYLKTLRTNCNERQNAQLLDLINTGELEFNSTDQTLRVPITHFARSRKKLLATSASRFAQAFEMQEYTKTYMREFKNRTKNLQNPDNLKIHRALNTLRTFALNSFSAAFTQFPVHAIKLIRNLLVTLKSAFIRLLQSWQIVSLCQRCLPHEESELGNDLVSVISVIDFIMYKLEPGTPMAGIEVEEIETSYEAFYKQNRKQFAIRLSAYVMPPYGRVGIPDF